MTVTTRGRLDAHRGDDGGVRCSLFRACPSSRLPRARAQAGLGGDPAPRAAEGNRLAASRASASWGAYVHIRASGVGLSRRLGRASARRQEAADELMKTWLPQPAMLQLSSGDVRDKPLLEAPTATAMDKHSPASTQCSELAAT